jgi:lipopolysaccharide/colanic/teichoic acid biosynthesis glycosyltransferase
VPKRIFDVVVAAAALVVLSPAFAVTGLLVRLTLGRPVLFRQPRPGRNGQPFVLYKFRTMRPAPSREAELLEDDGPRITRLGAALRATSLDELPELWNVLTGDMSLVGPRPLLMDYLDRFTPEQARRHEVRPGITGLAQAMGRNALTWEEKLALDVQYVNHRSMWLDLTILARTPALVCRREGITAAGSTSAPVFTGKVQRADVI